MAQQANASATSTNAAPVTRAISTRPRHSGLFQAVQRLDAQLDEAARRELADWIRDQYATSYGDIPLGFVARCHLGAPYVDHRMDLLHSIVEHYAAGDAVPAPFDRARTLARLSSYEFIEVYGSGVLVPVRVDGSVDAPIGGSLG
jgi:hypothetical protein